MRLKITLVLVVLCCLQEESSAAGCYDTSVAALCNEGENEIPHITSRDPDIMISNETSHWKFCDVYAIQTGQWYYSRSHMTSNCPSMYMCGTKFPIWMNGENPDQEEDIANRTACLRDYDTCCLQIYSLAAKNCGDFMVYCFNDLPSGCHQRYCFDVEESVSTEKSYTISTTPVTGPLSSKPSSTPDYITTNAKQISTVLSKTQDVATNTPNAQHTSTVVTKTEEQQIDEKNDLVIILMACMGLLIATVIGLIIVIVRRKRISKVINKTIDKIATQKEKKYETLGMQAIGVITLSKDIAVKKENDTNDHYESLNRLKETNRSMDQAGYDTLNPYQHYQTVIGDNGEREGVQSQDPRGGVKDDEQHYQTLP